MHSCCHGNIHYTHYLILSELFAPLIVVHVRSNLLLYCKSMQNLENLDVFEILITQKSTKMPEGPFCQIPTQLQFFAKTNCLSGPMEIRLNLPPL